MNMSINKRDLKMDDKTIYSFTIPHSKDKKGYLGYYMGRQQGFECMVCGKGCNCKTFNILHIKPDGSILEAIKRYEDNLDYETFGFGDEHFPDDIEEVSLKNVDIPSYLAMESWLESCDGKGDFEALYENKKEKYLKENNRTKENGYKGW